MSISISDRLVDRGLCILFRQRRQSVFALTTLVE
jgi:hypothetical protein